MKGLPLPSHISLYVILALFGLFSLMLWVLQSRILRGQAFENPDGSKDDWHEQKSFYGIVLGLAYITWTMIHFDVIYFP